MSILKTVKARLKSILLPHGLAPRRIRGGELAGFQMLLDLQEDTQVWRGIYEQALQSWVRRQVHPGAICFDVGAAEGWVALLMASRAPGGCVYAFEPSSRGDQIQETFRLNEGRPLADLRIVKALVGNPLGTPNGSQPDNSLSLISLDDFFDQSGLQRCDILKIDVDGPEVEVLQGAVKLIERFRPQMCVEIHSRLAFAEVGRRLADWGYRTSVVYPPAHEHRPIEFNPMIFAEHGLAEPETTADVPSS